MVKKRTDDGEQYQLSQPQNCKTPLMFTQRFLEHPGVGRFVEGGTDEERRRAL
jgi:hypothetical protein